MKDGRGGCWDPKRVGGTEGVAFWLEIYLLLANFAPDDFGGNRGLFMCLVLRFLFVVDIHGVLFFLRHVVAGVVHTQRREQTSYPFTDICDHQIGNGVYD